jgi:ABC-type transport system substrate-binding protein
MRRDDPRDNDRMRRPLPRPRPELPGARLAASAMLACAAWIAPCAPTVAADASANGALVASAPASGALPGAGSTPPKVLRYAFRVAESSFDPAAINDLYSRIVTGHIFEGLYAYDPLARPALLRPLTATALPEIENDFRRFTIHIQPGIYFADDPAFGGKRRELIAADYVYSLERIADPALHSPTWSTVDQNGILGLAELRRRALDGHQPFDYDAPVAGLKAIDRYTLRIELAEPRPRLVQVLAQSDLFGALAREVVDAYGQAIGAHPVGTGPFRLAEWRRASRMVLDRNPTYRTVTYDAKPADDDLEGRALLARFKGRRLPMIDRVEIAVIEQDQPRWLSFLNGDTDFVERVPEAFIDIAMPAGKLARDLSNKRIRAYRQLMPDENMTMFNMDDPVVGGYTPEHVALRRAIALGIDLERESRLARHGQMIAAQSQIVPFTSGYDPAFRSEMSEFDRGRARALLDLFGYVDRNHDGWREQPDGSPLTLVIGNQSDQSSHLLGELWQRNMDALGIQIDFRVAQWPENLKAARAGKLMVWDVNSQASSPDGQQSLERLYGPSAGGLNISRFRSKAFDDVYDRMLVLPDGPERDALFREAKRIAIAWMPYKIHGHRIVTDMSYPRLIGFRRPLFWQDWWEYVDIEPQKGRG